MIMSVCTHACCCIMELVHVWRALFVDLRSFLIVSRNIINTTFALRSFNFCSLHNVLTIATKFFIILQYDENVASNFKR